MSALVRRGMFFDLSDRAKLRITGADRLRYLNGQISNDLRKASDNVAIHACVLNAKGKLNADGFFRTEGEAFLVDADAAVRETLAARLERYIIADNVQVEDVTEQFALLHVIGDEMRGACSRRFAENGFDIWASRDLQAEISAEFSSRLTFCDATCAEVLRIELGIPRWAHELSEEIIPTEANLEAETIDYGKGCYIGQEVISRMRMSGQTNKRLCGLVANSALSAGLRLTNSDGKDVGGITSATWSERLRKNIALGFVKRGFNEIGNELLAGATKVTVAPLPLAGVGD
jgi:folate-binding protein YgfZ